jgi:hypothetical protein
MTLLFSRIIFANCANSAETSTFPAVLLAGEMLAAS